MTRGREEGSQWAQPRGRGPSRVGPVPPTTVPRTAEGAACTQVIRTRPAWAPPQVPVTGGDNAAATPQSVVSVRFAVAFHRVLPGREGCLRARRSSRGQWRASSRDCGSSQEQAAPEGRGSAGRRGGPVSSFVCPRGRQAGATPLCSNLPKADRRPASAGGHVKPTARAGPRPPGPALPPVPGPHELAGQRDRAGGVPRRGFSADCV